MWMSFFSAVLLGEEYGTSFHCLAISHPSLSILSRSFK